MTILLQYKILYLYLAVVPNVDGRPELLADLVTRLDDLELDDDHDLLVVRITGIADEVLDPDDGELL